jgi:uncharacterized SAM-binding protein YcdF (DUF218 family)/lysophospholipase L1-like esterase
MVRRLLSRLVKRRPVDGSVVAAATPPRGWRSQRRPFLAGLLAGMLVVVVGTEIINTSDWPDTIVQPLLPPDTSGRADAIVVLGAGLLGPCVANYNALRRSTLAAKLWRDGRAPIVVVTGGVPPGMPCSVAAVMADTIAELGVPRDRIHLEERSRNTHENAELTKPVLARLGAHRLLLVTDHLHMRRAQASFEHFGFQVGRASVPVFASSRDNVWMLRTGLREFAALAYYRSKGWLDAPPAGGTPVAPVRPQSSPGGGAMSTPATAPIVVIGASYAGGWSLPPIAGRPVVNKGVAGESSSQVLARFDRDVIALAPRAVVIWGYINDIHHAPPDQGDAAKTKARQNVTEMIRRAKAHGIEPIVVTELTLRASDSWSEWFMGMVGSVLGKESHQARINRHVMDLNTWLRQTAASEGLLVIDLQPALSDPDGQRRREFCKEDGSHVTDAGYRAATAYAEPLLTRRLAGR